MSANCSNLCFEFTVSSTEVLSWGEINVNCHAWSTKILAQVNFSFRGRPRRTGNIPPPGECMMSIETQSPGFSSDAEIAE